MCRHSSVSFRPRRSRCWTSAWALHSPPSPSGRRRWPNWSCATARKPGTTDIRRELQSFDRGNVLLHYYERTLVILEQNMISTRTLEAIATMPIVTKQNLGVLLGVSPATLDYRVQRMQVTGGLP